MAASVNKAIIIGNLGADPELRYTESNNTAVTTLSIATHEKYKTRDGEYQERTEWHRVTVFGRTAENCNQYLSKGRSVYVEGRIQTRKWQDKDGNDRYTTEVRVSGPGSTLTMLDGRGDGGGGGDYGRKISGGDDFGGGSGGGGGYGGGQGGGSDFDLDDDIPF